MHGDVYHEIPNGPFQDRRFWIACDSALMTVCFVFSSSFSKKLFLTKKLTLRIDIAASSRCQASLWHLLEATLSI
jgi:hypothetical protein